ncbi:TatD family hydrolase [Bacillus alkalicellulosilyticus]|uniref:TatD family hydrolase n=1 Tax=Alkalihalobacterium alkalicellulosilyticum TaxID=1912214 RepID=UPI0009968695|nr:TatD family hydrolase [Bacillus alkalicellulosilyticus]
MIDAHIHLDQYEDSFLDQQIDNWLSRGITNVVAVSTNLASSYRTLELKQKYPSFVLAAIGYHPEQKPVAPKEKQELFQLVNAEKESIVAIGEIGLPFYIKEKLSLNDILQYREDFQDWIELGVELSLPLSIHAVHSEATTALHLLKQVKGVQAHFHWLKAPEPVVAGIIEQGYMISVTPEVCYRSRDQELVQKIPMDQLLLETDGPWSFAGQFSERKTTPLFLYEMVETIAEMKKKGCSELAHKCQQNNNRFYKHS